MLRNFNPDSFEIGYIYIITYQKLGTLVRFHKKLDFGLLWQV